MTAEARIEQTETGLQPADEGWFILNLAEMSWAASEGAGTWSVFEPPSAPSAVLGIGVHVLYPGDAPGYYHAEAEQEGFLVLSGECIAVVEGQERRMRPWDYLHCPPGTAHITIGAGDAPCALLMVGTRGGGGVRYLPEPLAARYGASVQRESDSAREVYADHSPIMPARSPWPLPNT